METEARYDPPPKPDPMDLFVRLSVDTTQTDTFIELQRDGKLSPEHTLMLRILERALEEFTDGKRPRKRESFDRRSRRMASYRDARNWIYSADHDWIFSFVNCCEVLNIDPLYLRKVCKQYDRMAL
jgi:hypothetical protein